MTVNALLDCGSATPLLISHRFASTHSLSIYSLPNPIPLRLGDGSFCHGGGITHRTELLPVHIGPIPDRVHLDVAHIEEDMIVGLAWLHKINPDVLDIVENIVCEGYSWSLSYLLYVALFV